MSKVEKVKICCLKGVGSSTNAFKLIPFEGKDEFSKRPRMSGENSKSMGVPEVVPVAEVSSSGSFLDDLSVHTIEDVVPTEITIGRNEDNTVSIMSNMISRKHAIIKKNDQGLWTIYDNKSLNGITINGTKLKAMVPHTISEGDSIQLGVKVDQDKPADYVWKFYNKLGVKKLKQEISIQDSEISSSQNEAICLKEKNENGKRPNDENKSTPSKRFPSGKSSPRHPCKRTKVSESPDLWSPSAEMRRRLEEQEKAMAAQMETQEKAMAAQMEAQRQQLTDMQRLLAERDAAKDKLEEEMVKKEDEMRDQLQKQQESLELERRQFEAEVRRTFEEQLRDRETSLMSRLSAEKDQLMEEKRRVEASLTTEMERKLGEKDKDYQAQLEQEKEKLDKVIEQKGLHQKMLEAQLSETKTENERQKETMLHAKEDILANFTDLIETELQCSICSELFIQATSLSCSHSYCALCLKQWLAVKQECPMCRAPVTSHLRSIVLDSYIDKMVEHLSDDMKAKRAQLVAERKAETEKLEAKSKPPTATRGRGRVRGGGRGGGRARGRGGGTRGRGSTRATNGGTNPAPGGSGAVGVTTGGRVRVISVDEDDEAAAEVIDLGSDFSDSDEDEDEDEDGSQTSSHDSESSVEGDEGTYYGGYGSCFRCGHRGHWANGCPFY